MWTKSIMYPLIIFLFCLFVYPAVGIVARSGQARRRCHCAPPLCLLSGYTGFFSPFYVKWSHQRVCQLMLNTGKTEYLLFASAVLYAPRGSGTGGGGGGDSSNVRGSSSTASATAVVVGDKGCVEEFTKARP